MQQKERLEGIHLPRAEQGGLAKHLDLCKDGLLLLGEAGLQLPYTTMQ